LKINLKISYINYNLNELQILLIIMNINNLINDILIKTKLFWQYPVITEETFFNQNKHNNFYFGFPWATCIDKKINTNELLRLLINIKQNNINYYTCCQHISFRNYISLFKILGITILYTPHKIKGEDYINGIKIMPCPLYAVNVEDNNRNQEFKNIDLLNVNRSILYSFIGGVQTNYLTNIRNNIFNMKHPENSVIINTGDWHFNSTVYSQKQNINKDLNINNNHINNKILYNKTLLDSKFSLCPSGSGPNSIRFWESLGCGSIPVLLADTLDLPYNINWSEAIIIVNEDEYLNIPNILKNISEEEIYNRREKCLEIYNNLKNNFKNNFKN